MWLCLFSKYKSLNCVRSFWTFCRLASFLETQINHDMNAFADTISVPWYLADAFRKLSTFKPFQNTRIFLERGVSRSGIIAYIKHWRLLSKEYERTRRKFHLATGNSWCYYCACAKVNTHQCQPCQQWNEAKRRAVYSTTYGSRGYKCWTFIKHAAGVSVLF